MYAAAGMESDSDSSSETSPIIISNSHESIKSSLYRSDVSGKISEIAETTFSKSENSPNSSSGGIESGCDFGPITTSVPSCFSSDDSNISSCLQSESKEGISEIAETSLSRSGFSNSSTINSSGSELPLFYQFKGGIQSGVDSQSDTAFSAKSSCWLPSKSGEKSETEETFLPYTSNSTVCSGNIENVGKVLEREMEKAKPREAWESTDTTKVNDSKQNEGAQESTDKAEMNGSGKSIISHKSTETDPLPQPQIDDQKFQKPTKYGELEIFCTGINHPELLPLFESHALKFSDVLLLDDKQLQEIGITKMGVRRQILEATKSVHITKWKDSSLDDLKNIDTIDCPQAIAMMENIALHLIHMKNSVVFVRQKINADRRILEVAQDSANAHDLMDRIEDCIKDNAALTDALKYFQKSLNGILGAKVIIPADVAVQIVEIPGVKQKSARAALQIALTVAILGGVVWYFHPPKHKF